MKAQTKDTIVFEYIKSKPNRNGIIISQLIKGTRFKRSFLRNSVLRLEKQGKIRRVKIPDKYFAKIVNHWFVV